MNTQKNIAILGSGNIGLALAKGLVKAGIYQPHQITLTRRNLVALEELANEGYKVTDDNAKATSKAHIVVLAILPQQLNKLLDEINRSQIKALYECAMAIKSGKVPLRGDHIRHLEPFKQELSKMTDQNTSWESRKEVLQSDSKFASWLIAPLVSAVILGEV